MNKALCFVLAAGFASQVFSADLIETKNNKKYLGKIVKTVDGKVVIRTDEGNMIGIPRTSLARVTRGKEVFDFVTGERYYMERRRPFLPFTVLSVACGAYSVVKFQDAQQNRKKSLERRESEDAVDAQDLDDRSSRDRNAGILLAVCSAGTMVMALKPMEVKVPIGKIKISMAPTGVGLALNF